MIESPSLLRRWDRSGVPLLILRVVLAGIFLYMGVQKVQHPVEFLKAVRMYKMLPEEPAILLNSVAIVLPWLEVVAGVALLLGVWVRGSGALMALMLMVFTPAIFLRALTIHSEVGTPFFEIKFDCGCGAGEVIVWKKLLENFGLLALAIIVALSHSRRFCLDKWLDRRRANRRYCGNCGYLRDSLGNCCAA